MADDSMLRFVMIGARRYARDFGERAASARVILSAALWLYAQETSAETCALYAAETLGQIAPAERRKKATAASASGPGA